MSRGGRVSYAAEPGKLDQRRIGGELAGNVIGAVALVVSVVRLKA